VSRYEIVEGGIAESWKGVGGSGVLSPIQRAKIKKGSVDIKNHFFLSSYAKNYFFFYGLSVSRESLKNIPYLSHYTFARLVEQQDCVDLSKLNYNEIIKTMSLTTTITTTAAIWTTWRQTNLFLMHFFRLDNNKLLNEYTSQTIICNRFMNYLSFSHFSLSLTCTHTIKHTNSLIILRVIIFCWTKSHSIVMKMISYVTNSQMRTCMSIIGFTILYISNLSSFRCKKRKKG